MSDLLINNSFSFILDYQHGGALLLSSFDAPVSRPQFTRCARSTAASLLLLVVPFAWFAPQVQPPLPSSCKAGAAIAPLPAPLLPSWALDATDFDVLKLHMSAASLCSASTSSSPPLALSSQLHFYR